MSSAIINYLSDLEKNNHREWYHEHKSDYTKANREFEDIIQCLMNELGKEEPGILAYAPKDLTFKLVRDTRFSHDKSPYNPSLRCHISPMGKLPIPVGYFLFIHPGNQSFLGGGLFADMFKEATKMIRDHINTNGDEFESILTESKFAEAFKVEGTALKNVPKEYDPQHPMAEYLKYKSWYIEDHFDDALLEDIPAFIEYAAERFRLMKPFNDFLNRALKEFKMPAR